MSRYYVHECDWCKARSQWHIPFSNTAPVCPKPPEGWREVQDDPIVPSLLCTSCMGIRKRALETTRSATYEKSLVKEGTDT